MQLRGKKRSDSHDPPQGLQPITPSLSPSSLPSKPSCALSSKKLKKSRSQPNDAADKGDEVKFISSPVPADDAVSKWPHRYQCHHSSKAHKGKCISSIQPVKNGSNGGDSEEKEVLQARCHYTRALVDGVVFNLFDHAYISAEDENPHYIAKIVEMFETVNREAYITAQWFFRAEDTVIKQRQAHLIDERRVFYSDMRDDNPLGTIVAKVKIVQLAPDLEPNAKEKALASTDLYFDMAYSLKYYTFSTFDSGNSCTESNASTISDASSHTEKSPDVGTVRPELTLLDVYSGCGAMSSGLCLGASLGDLKLVTKWAVDIEAHACQSLQTNHPETMVRNEGAEDFLCLLKEWEKFCEEFQLLGSDDVNSRKNCSNDYESENESEDDGALLPGEYEVKKLLDVCYGDPNNTKQRALHFKVGWKNFDASYDTWEPIDGLRCRLTFIFNCKDRLKEFVTRGFESKLLPLPGDVDVLCGGLPCQGISGFNRFRHYKEPLKDEKNHQIVVFMDLVEYLKPKYVLMENVADILKFANGDLGCYAIGRLVSRNYQTRLGIMAAGAYGVPQCRMRVFLWGAQPTTVLPHFPLPTHKVAKKGVVMNEFKDIVVGYEDGQPCDLQRNVLLGDAISDLPAITNAEERDEMDYGSNPSTDFQKFIRTDLFGNLNSLKKTVSKKKFLFDHRPLCLNEDDYERACHIPKFKGANFRNLPGVLVGPNNMVQLDPIVARVLVKSGKPLVPDYALSFEDGKSTKPFGRLGLDDIVSTVVTRAKPHNQVILHPDQDRVLSVRENARLQGFPDCYRLCGSIKQRYIQVGNAVSFSVSIPLGYVLARAQEDVSTNKPIRLPFEFPECFGKFRKAGKT